MPTIFISFSTRDGKDIADHIYEHYKQKGYNVFYSPKEIPYGYSWREEIKKHIEECDIFLFIATWAAIESHEVAKEIDEAKRLGKRIIPCRPNDIDWSDLEKLGIDVAQGPEFDSKWELVRRIDLQLRREFGSIADRGLQNNVGQQKTGLLTSGKYEDRQKELELKKGIIDDISKAVTDIMVAIAFAEGVATDHTVDQARTIKAEENLENKYMDWETARLIIGTKIRAYFRNSNLPKMWDTFAQLVTNFSALVGITQEQDRKNWFEENKIFFSNPNIRLEDWKAIREDILKQKDDIITAILNSEISSLFG